MNPECVCAHNARVRVVSGVDVQVPVYIRLKVGRIPVVIRGWGRIVVPHGCQTPVGYGRVVCFRSDYNLSTVGINGKGLRLPISYRDWCGLVS